MSKQIVYQIWLPADIDKKIRICAAEKNCGKNKLAEEIVINFAKKIKGKK